VTLTEDERGQLQNLVSGGKGAVRRIKRAQILLAADARSPDQAIAINIGVGTSTVYRTKQRFVEEGLEQALSESPRPGVPRKLDASDESLLIAVACSRPPGGRAKWTMQLLADEMVRLTVHDTLSDETIRRRLAEMPLKPWQEKMWCIPEINAEYVARMEDVLQLYAEIPDPRCPVVCFDETPRQLIGEARVPIPAEPGKPRRVDYEYVRNGTANVFMFIDVNRPWRRAKVTDQRTCIDFAECMRDLVDVHYPEADSSASTAEYPIRTPLSRRSDVGSAVATRRAPRSTGSSPLTAPGKKWAERTPAPPVTLQYVPPRESVKTSVARY
jgi:transposase